MGSIKDDSYAHKDSKTRSKLMAQRINDEHAKQKKLPSGAGKTPPKNMKPNQN